MKTTIYDVAEKAGVSISTVSRVINNTGQISDKTRKKVLEVIESMEYQPSLVASALTGKRTGTIGLIIPDVANPFFAEIAREIEDQCRESGFSLLICNTENNPDTEEMYLDLLKQKSVDGLIIGTITRNPYVKDEYLQEDFPVARIAYDQRDWRIDAVLVDYFLGGHQAVTHLVQLGHKRLAIMTGNRSHAGNKFCYEAFCQVIAENKLALHEEWLIETDSTLEDGRQKALEILSSSDRPTALFASCDSLAIGVYQAAKTMGLRIPEDLSVVGFNNTILASVVDPPLTTIAQPIQEMSRKVMELLMREMEGEKLIKKRVFLAPELIVRSSTKKWDAAR